MPLCPGSETDWREVAAPPTVELTAREMERHSIYLLLAMALVFDSWCVNRTRPEQVQTYADGERERIFQDYLGHNVGALVVGPGEGILAFALNRNVELKSTLEHAEARAIRHALNRRNKSGESGRDLWSFTNLLKGARLYATLEPCSQCAGILELANLQSIVYAQDDPFQCGIVNVLYKLHLHLRPGIASLPVPIRATFLPFWDELSSSRARRKAGATATLSFRSPINAYSRAGREHRDFFRIRDDVGHQFSKWEESGKKNEYLLPRGVPLAEGQKILRGYGAELDAGMRDFISASSSRAQRLVVFLAAAAASFACIAIVAIYFYLDFSHQFAGGAEELRSRYQDRRQCCFVLFARFG